MNCKPIRLTAAPDVGATLASWLKWLEEVDGDEIKLGLDNCLRILRELGLDVVKPKVITVAGTNGKGSCCGYLEALLIDLGYKVATYTSPHVIRFNERIRVNNYEISSAEICEAFYGLSKASNSGALTYFEFVTIAALMIFSNYDLDFIVLEVGLGGRLDAINTIEPDVSLITSIGLDHTEWLGNTREEIALEKAGIMRPGKSVVCADKEVPFSIHSHASNIDAKLSVLGVDYSFELEDEFWDWSTKSRAFLALPYPAMFGKHQLRNISGVLKVLELLNIDERLLESSVRKVLPSLAILGRLQSIPNRLGMEIIVDVAHNEPAAEILSRRLQAMNRVKTTVGVLGILEAKDHLSFLKHFVPQLDYLYLVDLDHPRASQAQDVMKLAKSLDKKLETSCHSSCSQILGEIFKNNELIDRMVITGSFVTVGEAIKVIQGMHLDG